MAKVALITGGASGIGRAFAENLARRGHLVVLADRQGELAQEVADRIGKTGGRAVAAELDVRDRQAFVDLAQRVADEHGTIDYLFNNAGIAVGAAMADFSPADWHDVLDVNVRGVVHGVEAVYPIMIAQGSGHIINTASIAGLMPMSNEGSYTAAKHAVVGLSKSLRIEGRQHGVKVSVLCPGFINTPIIRGGKFGRISIKGLSDAKRDELIQRLRPMDVDTFADKSLRRVFANDFIIIFPRAWRVAWLIDRLVPNLSLRFWALVYDRLHEEIRKDVEANDADRSVGERGVAAGR